jgi:hypothetical protein
MYFNFFSNAGKIYKDNRYQDFNFFTDYNPTAPGSSVYTQPLKENIGYGINPQAVLLPTDVTNNFGISFEILFNGRIKYADTMYFKFLLNTYVKDSNNMLFAVFNWQRKSNVGWVTVNAPNLGATNINDKIKEAMAETITEILYDKLKTSDEYVNLIINNTLVSKL